MSDERPRMSSVLGVTGIVLGNVQGHGDFEVRGRVQGDIVLDGRVLVAAGGLVLGTIEALHIAVSGTVRGDLIAEDGVEISGSGQVEGNVTSPRVAIEAGAKVRGHLRTGEESPVAVRGNRDVAGLGEAKFAEEEPTGEEAEAPYDPIVMLPPEFAPGALPTGALPTGPLAAGALPAGALAAVALAAGEQADSAEARGTAGKRRRRRRRGGERPGNGEAPREETREREELRERRPALRADGPSSTRKKDEPRNEIIPPQRPTRPSGPLPPKETSREPARGPVGETAGEPAPKARAEGARRSKPLPTFVKGARGHLRS
jgi:cytoskeletal protein CcmA (bactofilin family)